VWSLGVVWFAALSGKLPFEGDGLTSVLLKVVNTAAPPLASLVPTLPRGLTIAVDRALRRDKNARHRTVREFARTILAEALAAGIDVPPDPEPLGLPDFARWRVEIASESKTAALRKVSAVAEAEAAAREPAHRSTTSPAPENGRPSRLGPMLLVLGLLAMLAAWWTLSAPTPATPPRRETRATSAPAPDAPAEESAQGAARPNGVGVVPPPATSAEQPRSIATPPEPATLRAERSPSGRPTSPRRRQRRDTRDPRHKETPSPDDVIELQDEWQ
jgi:serine/threonine-protein kinase